MAYRAGTILTMQPGAAPLDDGLIIVQDGVIAEVGRFRHLKKTCTGPVQDLGDSILTPGLVNAHTHIELSHLQGRTTLGQGFEPWVRSLIKQPMGGIDQASLNSALEGIRRSGTAGLGDISGHNPQGVLAGLTASGLEFRLFLEFLGFSRPKSKKPVWPEGTNPNKDHRLSATGHALYSTHPGTLQQLKTWSLDRNRTFTMHLAEHSGEFDLLTTGRGDFAEMIKPLLLPADYVAPGLTPVSYADRLGLLDQGTLAVHCVQVTEEDIELLVQRNVALCLCPRSNDLIGVGRAPRERFYQRGLRLCLGTDSLASNRDLDLWSELEYFSNGWTGPHLSLVELLELVTSNPARALGLQDRLGSLEPGKAARFSLVPDGLRQLPLERQHPGRSSGIGS